MRLQFAYCLHVFRPNHLIFTLAALGLLCNTSSAGSIPSSPGRATSALGRARSSDPRDWGLTPECERGFEQMYNDSDYVLVRDRFYQANADCAAPEPDAPEGRVCEKLLAELEDACHAGPRAVCGFRFRYGWDSRDRGSRHSQQATARFRTNRFHNFRCVPMECEDYFNRGRIERALERFWLQSAPALTGADLLIDCESPGPSDEHHTISRINRFYEDLSEGVAFSLRHFDNATKWVIWGPQGYATTDTFYGHEGVVRFFALHNSQWTLNHFEPLRFFLDDSRPDQTQVAVQGWETGRMEDTGRPMEIQWTHTFFFNKQLRIQDFNEHMALRID